MGKYVIKMLPVFLILYLFSCESEGAKVSIKLSAEEGIAPFAVEIDTSGTEPDGMSEIIAYQYRILEGDVEVDSPVSNESKLKYIFRKAGVYEVEVIASDNFGAVGKAKAKVTVHSPFKGKTVDFPETEFYQNRYLVLPADSLGVSGVQFNWKIYNPSNTLIVDVLDTGAFLELEGFDSLGDYKAVITVVDVNGNTADFEKTFSIISIDSPEPVISVTYNGGNPASAQIYEYEAVALSAVGSKAAASDAPGIVFKKFSWSVLRNGELIEVIEKDSANSFEYSLDQAGYYNFIVELENSVAEKKSSEIISLTIFENKPVISNVVLPSEIYEGKACSISVNYDVPGDYLSDIIEAKIEFTNGKILNFSNFNIGEFVWTPEYIEDSSADKNVTGYVFIKSAAERYSEGFSFSTTVKNNNPSAVFNCNTTKVIYDSTILFDISSVSSPDGNLETAVFKLVNSSDVEIFSKNLIRDGFDDITYNFSGVESIGTYSAVVEVSNVNGTVVAEKGIEITDKQAIAYFDITSDSGNSIFYQGDVLTFDADASCGADGLQIPEDNFAWVLKKDGVVIGSPVKKSPRIYELFLSGESSGRYFAELTVIDNAGNESIYSRDFIIELNYPTNIEVIKLTGESTPGNQVLQVSGISPDGDALSYTWYEELPEAASVAFATGDKVTFNYDDGNDYSVYVVAVNSDGYSTVTKFIVVADDLTPPVAPRISSDYVDFLTNDVSPVFNIAGSSDSVIYRYAFNSIPADDSDWTETASSQITSSVDYSHGDEVRVYVQAADEAGNWSDTADFEGNGYSYAVTIDTQAPAIPDVVSVAARTQSRDIEWTWSCSDSVHRYRYSLNSEEESSFNEVEDSILAFSAENLVDDHYTLYVQSRDKAGNWSDSGEFTVTVDNAGPELALIGDDPLYWNVDVAFVDPGITAHDVLQDADVSFVIGGDSVDSSVLNATYMVEYSAQDDLGNSSVISRTVIIQDIEDPVINLTGDSDFVMVRLTEYVDPGYSYSDNYSDNANINFSIDNNLDNTTVGFYKITYNAEDEAGNSVSKSRNIIVIPEVISINGHPTTGDVEFNITSADGGVSFGWDSVPGVTGYRIYRPANFTGPYTELDTSENQVFSETCNQGVWFYKVKGYIGGYEGDFSPVIIKAAKAVVPTGVTAVSDFNNFNFSIDWDSCSGADSYFVYAGRGTDDTSKMAVCSDDLSGSTSVDPLTLDFTAADSIDGISGNEYSYRFAAHVDKEARGWTGGGTLVAFSDSTVFPVLSNDQWVDYVMKEIYECTKFHHWANSPYSDYWNASPWPKYEDRKKVNNGFSVDPAGVPDNLPGAMVAGPYVQIAKFNEATGNTLIWNTRDNSEADPNLVNNSLKLGRSINEVVRSKESDGDSLNDGDYVLTRWWFDNCSANFMVLNGNRRYDHDWYGTTKHIYGDIQVKGIYPGLIRFNWMSTDEAYTQDGGSGITGGNYQIDRNGDGTTEFSNVAHDNSKHFTW